MVGVQAAVRAGSEFVEALRPELRAFMDMRADHLAAGAPRIGRASDVAALVGVQAPVFTGALDVRLAGRLRLAVKDALKGVEPYLLVNRRESDAERLLRGSGRIPNMYDSFDAGIDFSGQLAIDPIAEVVRRVEDEVRFGTFGTGTTIYGSVHFDDLVHAPQQTHRGLIRHRDVQLDAGPNQYGRVSLRLDDRVLADTTFLYTDSWHARPGAVARPIEQLEDVVVERIVHSFGADKPLVRGDKLWHTPFEAVIFDDIPRARTQRMLRQILELPKREQRADAIRAHITSSAVNDAYIEAQIRRADVSDIREVRISDVTGINSLPVDLIEDAQDAIRGVAALRGIPIRTDDRMGGIRND